MALRRVEPWDIEAGSGQHGDGDESWEIAIDLRRAKPEVDRSLDSSSHSPTARDGARSPLEDWRPGSKSLIWGFNSLYWKALSLWEQATGKGYESGPAWRRERRPQRRGRPRADPASCSTLWDGLAARRALPEELYVLELGVGNGNQAAVWLDEFRRLDRETGRDYYRRLHYLMGDYSPHVLELRAQERRRTTPSTSAAWCWTPLRPTETLGFLRYKAFLVYISNVYDNLPTDEIVRIGGHLFQVETRARTCRAGRRREHWPPSVNVAPEELPDLVARLLRLGPELLAEVATGAFPDGRRRRCASGGAVWDALRLEERYVPLDELDTYEIAPGRQRRVAAADRRSQRRPAHARQQRRRRQLRRHAAAAASATACCSATTCS